MKAPPRLLSIVLLVSLSLAAGFSHASAFESRQFKTDEQAARYRKMTHELRCLVCQNQDIADSNADLAKDLRDKVYTMIMDGHSDADIIDFMVARYGDFVLYRPPLKFSTLVLWIGPFVVLLIALVVLLRYIRRRQGDRGARPQLSNEQHNQAAQLLTAHPPED